MSSCRLPREEPEEAGRSIGAAALGAVAPLAVHRRGRGAVSTAFIEGLMKLALGAAARAFGLRPFGLPITDPRGAAERLCMEDRSCSGGRGPAESAGSGAAPPRGRPRGGSGFVCERISGVSGALIAGASGSARCDSARAGAGASAAGAGAGDDFWRGREGGWRSAADGTSATNASAGAGTLLLARLEMPALVPCMVCGGIGGAGSTTAEAAGVAQRLKRPMTVNMSLSLLRLASRTAPHAAGRVACRARHKRPWTLNHGRGQFETAQGKFGRLAGNAGKLR